MHERQPKKIDSSEVAAILPFVGNKVLMQLRDFNPNISHPGCWGYFSGSVQVGEEPIQAAKRELLEETGYEADRMTELGQILIGDRNNLVVHTFSCSVRVPLEQLTLSEGVEMALVSPEEIQSKRIYSKSMKKFFPVAATTYIQEALTLALGARK